MPITKTISGGVSNDPTYIPKMNGPTDECLLLQQLASGKEEVFTLLFNKYQAKLYYYLLPFTEGTALDPDEIIQDIFVNIWLKKETFAGIRHFEYYLYRMARNRLVDIFRKERSRQKHESLVGLRAESPDYQTEQEILIKEYHELAQRAIDLLPERRRKIFALSTQQDLSLDEIALHLGLSKEVVKKQLYLASRFIREYLIRYGDVIICILLTFNIL